MCADENVIDEFVLESTPWDMIHPVGSPGTEWSNQVNSTGNELKKCNLCHRQQIRQRVNLIKMTPTEADIH